MKKRLQTRVMFRIPNSHLHASAVWSDRRFPSQYNCICKTIPADIKRQNRKKKSYPLDRLLLRAALRRPSPLRYLGSDTIVRSPYATNLTSHRKSWAPCAHHGHME